MSEIFNHLNISHGGISHYLYCLLDFFENIVDVACNLGEFEWVEHFLKGHKDYVKEEIFEKITLLFECQISFKEQKYKETFLKLESVGYQDISFAFRRFALQVKSLYEEYKEEARDEIERLKKNFVNYLNRRRANTNLVEEVRTRMMNFTSLVIDLAQPSFVRDFTKEELKEKFEGIKDQSIENEWLWRKIQELKR